MARINRREFLKQVTSATGAVAVTAFISVLQQTAPRLLIHFLVNS
ncbi:MAG: twin-arginine translocation signal domain-containing protein [Anaerolineaceae bacterium]